MAAYDIIICLLSRSDNRDPTAIDHSTIYETESFKLSFVDGKRPPCMLINNNCLLSFNCTYMHTYIKE